MQRTRDTERHNAEPAAQMKVSMYSSQSTGSSHPEMGKFCIAMIWYKGLAGNKTQ